jgi:hypothetical protein
MSSAIVRQSRTHIGRITSKLPTIQTVKVCTMLRANGLSTGELSCFDIPYQRLTEDYGLARARLLRSQ